MYRRGTVVEVDAARCRARVRFPDREDVESPWLEVLQRNTADNRDYGLPDIGELVAVLMDERDEAGCVLGALYAGTNTPPSPSQDVRRVTFGDGTVVEYDRDAHRLRVSVAAGTTLVSAEGVEIDANVTVRGGSEPVALADKVQGALGDLKDAISAASTVPTDGGAAFKTNILAALAAWPPSVHSEALRSD